MSKPKSLTPLRKFDKYSPFLRRKRYTKITGHILFRLACGNRWRPTADIRFQTHQTDFSVADTGSRCRLATIYRCAVHRERGMHMSMLNYTIGSQPGGKLPRLGNVALFILVKGCLFSVRQAQPNKTQNRETATVKKQAQPP